MAEPYGPPRLAAVVPFLFGVADRPRLPGTVLVRLLTDVGASQSAARSALARLRTEGGLRSIRRGRQTDYELAGLVAASFRRARTEANPEAEDTESIPTVPGSTAWSGEFHGILYTVPEDARAHRDRLRSAARLVGYAPLRPGLMISPGDGWSDLAEVVAALPASATVYPLVLKLGTRDARRAATEAWGLSQTAANTRSLIDRLLAAANDAVPVAPGPAALRSYVALALPAYHFFVGIPRLPSEVLPDDWPVPQLVSALGRVRSRIGVAAESYLDEVLREGASGR